MSDGLVLVGLPGSGKTSVGRLLAQRLDRRFIDIDDEVERISGRTAADLIETDGEPAMRAIEQQAVAAAVAVPDALIAAGGGTIVEPLNRWALMEHGTRIMLNVPSDVLAARLAGNSTPRPLLGDDLEEALRRTAAQRAAVYAAVDLTIDADRPIEAVVDATIDAASSMKPHRWRTLFDAEFDRHHSIGPRTGRVLLGVGLDGGFLRTALEPFEGQRPIGFADRRAFAAHPSMLDAIEVTRMCQVDGGENVKDFHHLEEVLTWLSEIGAERLDPLVVIGGGTIGDLGGLAAALHQRGMPLVSVPTTWLAQADSAIGGKVAIDLPAAKNGVGAFWPAWVTISDAAMLDSLPIERRRDGIAECLKMGLIGDPALWGLVEARGTDAVAGHDRAAVYAMTERAARLKLQIVDDDPHERGRRRELNLGHTLGHALEIESRYELGHGDAVALGLRAVAAIAELRGAEPGLAERIDGVLHAIGFPFQRGFDRNVVVASLRSDKKRRQGVLRWILPMAVGRVAEVDDVTPREIDIALDRISR